MKLEMIFTCDKCGEESRFEFQRRIKLDPKKFKPRTLGEIWKSDEGEKDLRIRAELAVQMYESFHGEFKRTPLTDENE